MKKSALYYLFVTVAGLAAALLPVNILAAPGDLFESDQGSDGLSYTHLFREKNRGKHVAKYQLFQTAISQILMATIKVFLRILSASGPNSALSTGALNQLLKL